MRLIWGDVAFTETNFTPIFLFTMYDVYVATLFRENTVQFLAQPSILSRLRSTSSVCDAHAVTELTNNEGKFPATK